MKHITTKLNIKNWASILRLGKAQRNRGDTIVEVMISLVILSMIIATVYAMGARSLRVGTESNQRTEAVSAAQSQIDLLINAKNVDPSFATNYQTTGQAFCLKPDGTKDTSAQTNTNKLCNNYNGTQYNVGISYNSNLFTITTQWPSPDAPGGIATLNLYYKMPGTYKKAIASAGNAKVVGTTATVNGTVNPNGNLVTDCYFNYDTSTSYPAPTKVACSALPGSGTTPVDVSATISGLAPETTYYFQLCATTIVGTACSPNNGQFTTLAKPDIRNESVDIANSSGNNAKLDAMVNPRGSEVTYCRFEWGVTTSYGAGKDCGGTIGSGTTLVSVTANAAPLNAGTTYHFRVVAANAVGTTVGGDHTFVASYPSPVVTTGSASSVTASSATLNGTINPKGGTVSYQFQYGTTSSYGSTTSAGSVSGGATVSVSSGIGGLSSGPMYHFRLCATSSNGTVCGGDATFALAPTINSLTAKTPPSNSYGFSYSNGQTLYSSTGVSRTLQWTSTNANYCNASGGWSANNLGANGELGVTAYPGTSYVLTCFNSVGGSSSTTFNFGYTNSYFTLWSGWCSWGPCGYTLSYGEGGQQGSTYSMPGDASGITFGNGIGSLCANLDQRGWGVRPPTNTALCGGYYCWTFSSTTFLGEIPFHNGGNWASFNDSVVGGIAGRDCNNN